jgi:hypothetical protein
MSIIEIILKALENQINLIIIGIIGFLAIIDLIFKKDLKSQIVSLGVLGTFIGIFMGLQDFNPNDMKNSINTILIGLKTAFFTSIAGMGVALILSIIQKLFKKVSEDSQVHEILLKEISIKLNFLGKMDNSKDTDRIIGELERLRTIQSDTRSETEKISISINELRDNSSKENKELISILNTNFTRMNQSLELAIEQLSKGATEEIISALKQVIEEFNQELQTQFGSNFVKLNESVINLLQWQNNYKTHIEELEKRLTLSTLSIEKSKDSLEIISSKNEDVLKIYQELHNIINHYDKQVRELNQHLETYSLLSKNAKNMFSTIQETVGMTKKEFNELSKVIISENEKQKNSFEANTDEIKKFYSDLTIHLKDEQTSQVKNTLNNMNLTMNSIKHSYSKLTTNIELENSKQINFSKKATKEISQNIEEKIIEITSDINKLTLSYEKNKTELNLIINHFRSMGEQIPKALEVSLEELNRGLTSLTKQFQKDYKEIMDNYEEGMRQ